MNRRSLWLGLSALFAALAPAPAPAPAPQDAPPPPPPSLAEARIQTAVRAYDLAWLYYSENRIPSEKVYRWSRWLLEAQREATGDRAAVVAACEGHLERMKKVHAKVARIRKIGFGDSLDVIEVDYYLKEADFWVEQARAAK